MKNCIKMRLSWILHEATSNAYLVGTPGPDQDIRDPSGSLIEEASGFWVWVILSPVIIRVKSIESCFFYFFDLFYESVYQFSQFRVCNTEEEDHLKTFAGRANFPFSRGAMSPCHVTMPCHLPCHPATSSTLAIWVSNESLFYFLFIWSLHLHQGALYKDLWSSKEGEESN